MKIQRITVPATRQFTLKRSRPMVRSDQARFEIMSWQRQFGFHTGPPNFYEVTVRTEQTALYEQRTSILIFKSPQ